MTGFDVAVVGQIARDLVLSARELSDVDTYLPVDDRETLGGTGATQAVSIARLGGRVALVGVVGDDACADRLLGLAEADGVDVRAVCRRQHCRTGLIVDVADARPRRSFADLPLPVLLTGDDVTASVDVLASARVVVVQAHQPAAAALAAVRAATGVVVLDGAPADHDIAAGLLANAGVVRADVAEAESLVGRSIPDTFAALRAARSLLDAGPRLVAFSTPTATVLASPNGDTILPASDPTRYTAALTLAIARGHDWLRWAGPERHVQPTGC